MKTLSIPRNRIVSVITALAVVFAALGAFNLMPLKVSAASDNTTIDIGELTADITTFTNWSYDLASNTLTITDNVTITGSASGASTTLNIDIAPSATVTYNATYEGTVAGWGFESLINLTGSGTFNMTSGTVRNAADAPAIRNTGASTLNIGGGTVENTVTVGYGLAIRNDGAGAVNISGGTVKAGSDCAILGDVLSTGKITISGAAVVTSAGNQTICLWGGAAGTILEITGGTIENTASNDAIYTDAPGAVDISDGTITGNIISDTVNINGGTITGDIMGYNAVNIDGGTITGDIWSWDAVNISGGTINGDIWSWDAVNISGGTINGDITGGTITCNAHAPEANDCTTCKYCAASILIHTPVSVWDGGTAATCTTASTRTKSCTVCGLTAETEIQGALGHTTTTPGATCTRCNYKIPGGNSGGTPPPTDPPNNPSNPTPPSTPTMGGGAPSTNSKPTQPKGALSNLTYVYGSGMDLIYTVDKDFSLFNKGGSVSVNGKSLTRDAHYKAESGSTIITVFGDYLETLETGEHKLTVRFKDNTSVSVSFYISEDISSGAGISVNSEQLTVNSYGGDKTARVIISVTLIFAVWTISGAVIIKRKKQK